MTDLARIPIVRPDLEALDRAEVVGLYHGAATQCPRCASVYLPYVRCDAVWMREDPCTECTCSGEAVACVDVWVTVRPVDQ